MKSSGDLIRDWMSDRNISQRKLSRDTGLSQAFISKIISKKVYISIKNTLLFEKYTGIKAKIFLVADIEYRLEQQEERSNS